MIAYYPMLIEFCIELKRLSGKYIADFKKEAHNESMSDRVAPLVNGYTLKHHPKNDVIYYLKDSQTIKERVTEIKSLELKPAQIGHISEVQMQ